MASNSVIERLRSRLAEIETDRLPWARLGKAWWDAITDQEFAEFQRQQEERNMCPPKSLEKGRACVSLVVARLEREAADIRAVLEAWDAANPAPAAKKDT